MSQPLVGAPSFWPSDTSIGEPEGGAHKGQPVDSPERCPGDGVATGDSVPAAPFPMAPDQLARDVAAIAAARDALFSRDGEIAAAGVERVGVRPWRSRRGRLATLRRRSAAPILATALFVMMIAVGLAAAAWIVALCR
jgi:hypothetical protein